jgi:acetyl-CoA acyltransferase 2
VSNAPARQSADLGVVATKAAIAQANIDPNKIEDIYFGNVSQTAIDTPYLARHVGLRSGIAEETPALTVNRLCGAGFESVVLATKGILCGESKVSLAGGAETMSMAPYAVRDIRKGTKFPNNLVLEDTLWSALNDQHIKMPMALTAEKVTKPLIMHTLQGPNILLETTKPAGTDRKTLDDRF